MKRDLGVGSDIYQTRTEVRCYIVMTCDVRAQPGGSQRCEDAQASRCTSSSICSFTLPLRCHSRSTAAEIPKQVEYHTFHFIALLMLVKGASTHCRFENDRTFAKCMLNRDRALRPFEPTDGECWLVPLRSLPGIKFGTKCLDKYHHSDIVGGIPFYKIILMLECVAQRNETPQRPLWRKVS